MSVKIPPVARLAFGERTSQLRTNLAEVEKLLHSDAENQRAGAVALLATQFELSKDALIAKLKSCRIGERSRLVNETIHQYLRPLTITPESIQRRLKIRTLAKASFESHLENIQHGSHVEKLAALLFAFTHSEANSKAVQEVCEFAIKDADPEIRCGEMSAMAHPHYATFNREAASAYAKIALDEN